MGISPNFLGLGLQGIGVLSQIRFRFRLRVEEGGEMQTSLRYGGDSKSLRIRAKEKFPLVNSKFQLQVSLSLSLRFLMLDSVERTRNSYKYEVSNGFLEIRSEEFPTRQNLFVSSEGK